MMIGLVRQTLGDDLRGGNAIHARHVDVHDDDVGTHVHRDLDRFLAGAGRAGHVDLALQPEEPRQVVARLRDVVDDEDLDHAWDLQADRGRREPPTGVASSFSCSTMSGIGTPYSVDELVEGDAGRVLDGVVVRVAQDRGQRVRCSLRSLCANLMTSAS